MMAECDFCPNKEEKPEVGMPEGWARWLVSSNVYMTFCRACVPRVAQFLTQKLKTTVMAAEVLDDMDHAGYHVDTDHNDQGERVGVLVANPNCPYCRETDRRANRLEWAAQIWCRPENAGREMDSALAQSIANALGEREGPKDVTVD